MNALHKFKWDLTSRNFQRMNPHSFLQSSAVHVFQLSIKPCYNSRHTQGSAWKRRNHQVSFAIRFPCSQLRQCQGYDAFHLHRSSRETPDQLQCWRHHWFWLVLHGYSSQGQHSPFECASDHYISGRVENIVMAKDQLKKKEVEERITKDFRGEKVRGELRTRWWHVCLNETCEMGDLLA